MISQQKSLIVFLGLSLLPPASLSLPNNNQIKYEQKIFSKQSFSNLICDKKLKRIERKLDNDTEIACQDAQGKLQGIAIRLNPKRVKIRVHIYRDSHITDEHTAEWDETGKIAYTEEPNLRTSWYNFKKKKKHVETTILENRKETRVWYENGNLQSVSVEQDGLPTKVLGWDEDGNKLGSNP